MLKNFILAGTGRKNEQLSVTMSPDVLEQLRKSLNHSIGGLSFGYVPEQENGTTEQGEASHNVEKIRKFYPSCELPRNTDEDMWKDANTMNLFFGVNYGNNDDSTPVNVASATLRLYRLSQQRNSSATPEDCLRGKENDEDDQQIRVSVYWYSRSLKKHKAIKRRLTDSRMVTLTSNQSYIELNIRPAARSWTRSGRNLGLGIVVEDVDGILLSASHYFRDVGCNTVGNVSTPKPIPSVVIDSFKSGLGLSANNTDASTDGYHPLVPVLDICTVEPMRNITVPTEEDNQGPCFHNIGRVKSSASLVKSNDDSSTYHPRPMRHHRQHERDARLAAKKSIASHRPQTSRDDR